MENGQQPLGIYIHIPFCEKKCDYCDFLSHPADEEEKSAYVQALLAEIKSYKGVMKEYLVKTIFVGGGTPSSIREYDIKSIIEAINHTFEVDGDEITIEVNPGTLTKEKLSSYKHSGINRLSIGLQSTNNKELKVLGRIHTYETFLENYELARDLGFKNINIDLMSALPGQTLDSWMDTLKKVVELAPEHISAYSLIIEEGTPFFERYHEEDQDEELDRQIYSMTKTLLEEKGYYQYEISNFAKPGYECKHNLSYWNRTQYLGIGLGASSFIHNTRFHNEEDLNQYIKFFSDDKTTSGTGCKLQGCSIRKDIHNLTKQEAMEEFMFLGLRKIKGISKKEFKDEFSVEIEEIYGDVLKKSFSEKLLKEKEDYIYLTNYGIDISNIILSRFLLS